MGYLEICSTNAGAHFRVVQDVKEDIDAVAEGVLCAGSARTFSVVEGELPGDLVPDVDAGLANWCGDAEGLLELSSVEHSYHNHFYFCMKLFCIV